MLAVFALGLPARALIINAIYDTSVTSAPEAAQIESAFNWVVQTYENQFTNAITVNIGVYWGASPNLGQVGLGASYTTAIGVDSYAQVLSALRAARSDSYDSNAVSSLPATDPTGNGQWFVPTAEAKALNLYSANDPGIDGEVGFGTNGVSYTFDPTNRIVPGEFDFISVAEHELTEAMGRTNFGLDSTTNYIPFDLFRFTSSGVRTFADEVANAYFSIDDGVTELEFFNDQSSGGDAQDWATGAVPDSFDAFTSTDEEGYLSTNDFIAMDILGFNSPGIKSAHVTGTLLANGNLQLTFTNLAATSFSVLATTNLTTPLSDWTVLGTAVEYPVGKYNFVDTQPAGQRFYRVRSP